MEASNFEINAKEEREIQVYGFSLKDFKKESKKSLKFPQNNSKLFSILDFQFIKQSIETETRTLCEMLKNLVKDLNPSLPSAIDALVPGTVESIFKSCTEDINKINDHLEQSLKIGDDVLLFEESKYLEKTTPEEEQALEKECEEMEKKILSNAVFIHALHNELCVYESILEETIPIEDFVMSQYQQQQDNVVTAELLTRVSRNLSEL